MNTRFFNSWNKTDTENKILLSLIIGLIFAIIVLSFTVLKLANSKTFVVLPPQVDKEFWVVGNNLSHTYFEQVSFYMADRIMNVNPKTASSSFDSIIPFLTADRKALNGIQKVLNELAEFIKKENIYQSFYPEKLTVKDNILSVEGSSRRYIGDMYVHEVNTTLDFSYIVKNGRLIIQSIEVTK